MAPTHLQRSFASGELSGSVDTRADLEKYLHGLSRARNSYVTRSGALVNRPGFEYLGESEDSVGTRLLPFIFNDAQTYVLELVERSSGDDPSRIYIWQDGARLTVDGATLSAWVDADYAAGDLVKHPGGSPLYYCRRAHEAGNSAVTSPISGSDAQTYWTILSTDTTGDYWIPSPWTADQVLGRGGVRPVDFAQANDVMILVHQGVTPHTLSRLGQLQWTLLPTVFQPSTQRPSNLAAVNADAESAGSFARRYKVAAVDAATGKESVGSIGTAIDLDCTLEMDTAPTFTQPRVTTNTPHGLAVGERVIFDIDNLQAIFHAPFPSDEIQRMLRGREFVVTDIPAADEFLIELDPEGDTGTYDLPVHLPYVEHLGKQAMQGDSGVNLSWNVVPGAQQYEIYRDDGQSGRYGYLASARNTSFYDDARTPPSYAESEALWADPFRKAGDYPGAVSFFQQRLVLGSTANDPAKLWFSRQGDVFNFTTRFPNAADDALSRDIPAREAQEILSMVDLGGALILFTSQGAWRVQGDADGLLNPQFRIEQVTINGSAPTRALVVDRAAMFVHARGSQVYDFAYALQADGFQPRDLTVLAAHLITGFELTDWGYARVPDSVVWARRDDGSLLALTYLPEQNLLAWTASHSCLTVNWTETDDPVFGAVEPIGSLAVVPEGTTDAVYAVFTRQIGSTGLTRESIERMAPRKAGSPTYDIRADAKFLDSFATYDGTNTAALTLRIDGASYDVGDVVTLTASSALFDAGDVDIVGFRLFTTNEEDQVVEVQGLVTAFTSTTVVSLTISAARADGVGVTVADTELTATPLLTWVRMVDVVDTGLSHLDNRQVAVLADGVPIMNKRVSGGMITVPEPAGIIHVGLPIDCWGRTLDFDLQGVPRDQHKHMPWADFIVAQTRGLLAGPTDTVLAETKGHDDDPLVLTDGALRVTLPTRAQETRGRVTFRQAKPLPFTLLGINRAYSSGESR